MIRSRRCHIAVLGGGAGSLAAIFHLTTEPNWHRDFSITVYQMGWRLGGKGASGRNLQCHARIEEHGLHVWPGFYDQAFRLVRACYDELGRSANAPLHSWQQAFRPQRHIVLTEREGAQWLPWSYHAPDGAGLPGDRRPTRGVLHLVAATFRLLNRLFDSLHREVATIGNCDSFSTHTCPTIPCELLETFTHVRHCDASRPFQTVQRLIGHWQQHQRGTGDRLANVLEWLADTIRQTIQTFRETSHRYRTALRRLVVFIDLMATNLVGLLRDQVVEHGFEAIDNERYVDWLAKHGAHPHTIDSALVRGLHDFVFARDPQHPDQLNLAAGVALRLSLKTAVGYRGAMMYKLAAGMGDIVFAPLYEVLKRRGVRFEFFHQVQRIETDRMGERVTRVHLARQARLSVSEYQPLMEIRGLPCWPAQPLWNQVRPLSLADYWERTAGNQPAAFHPGEAVTLQAGRDFDQIICGLPLDVMRHVAAPLADHHGAWEQMFLHLKSTRTVAAQLWRGRPFDTTGWRGDSPILTGYAPPFETWSDMTHSLAWENWPVDCEGEVPTGVAYLCGTWPDPSAGAEQGEGEIPPTELFQSWLARHGAQLWHDGQRPPPAAHRIPEGVDRAQRNPEPANWTDAGPVRGENSSQAKEYQYVRGNCDPSERYILSLAGTTRFRLPAADTGLANLVLAGDWTRTELNVGCVEGAVDSGRNAALGILGSLDRASFDP